MRIAYNSCRNRHCPKCQGLARAQWRVDRHAELLPVPYFHVVFTMPAATLRTIAADPRHLGAEIGFVAVLHSWGQALQHPVLTLSDWAPGDWGTSGNATEYWYTPYHLEFATNAHPRPVMLAMSHLLGDEATIRVEFADTKRIGSNCGSYDLRGGVVVAQVPLEPGSLEAIRHSCAVIGADYYDYLDEMGIEWPAPEQAAVTEVMSVSG